MAANVPSNKKTKPDQESMSLIYSNRNLVYRAIKLYYKNLSDLTEDEVRELKQDVYLYLLKYSHSIYNGSKQYKISTVIYRAVRSAIIRIQYYRTRPCRNTQDHARLFQQIPDGDDPAMSDPNFYRSMDQVEFNDCIDRLGSLLKKKDRLLLLNLVDYHVHGKLNNLIEVAKNSKLKGSKVTLMKKLHEGLNNIKNIIEREALFL